MAKEHTKLPWEVSDQPAMGKGVIWFHRIYCRGTLAPARGCGDTPEEAKANATFIVRACSVFADIEEGISLIVRKDHYYQLEAQANGHEELVEVVEKQGKLLCDIGFRKHYIKSHDDLLAVCVKIKAASDATPEDCHVFLTALDDCWDELEAAIAKATG